MAQVTVSEFKLRDWRHSQTTNLELRVTANQSFVTSDGVLIEGAPKVYRKIAATVANETIAGMSIPVLTVPSFWIDSTSDAITNQWATYKFTINDSRSGKLIEALDLAQNCFITGTTPITIPQIIQYNIFANRYAQSQYNSVNELTQYILTVTGAQGTAFRIPRIQTDGSGFEESIYAALSSPATQFGSMVGGANLGGVGTGGNAQRWQTIYGTSLDITSFIQATNGDAVNASFNVQRAFIDTHNFTAGAATIQPGVLLNYEPDLTAQPGSKQYVGTYNRAVISNPPNSTDSVAFFNQIRVPAGASAQTFNTALGVWNLIRIQSPITQVSGQFNQFEFSHTHDILASYSTLLSNSASLFPAGTTVDSVEFFRAAIDKTTPLGTVNKVFGVRLRDGANWSTLSASRWAFVAENGTGKYRLGLDYTDPSTSFAIISASDPSAITALEVRDVTALSGTPTTAYGFQYTRDSGLSLKRTGVNQRGEFIRRYDTTVTGFARETIARFEGAASITSGLIVPAYQVLSALGNNYVSANWQSADFKFYGLAEADVTPPAGQLQVRILGVDYPILDFPTTAFLNYSYILTVHVTQNSTGDCICYAHAEVMGDGGALIGRSATRRLPVAAPLGTFLTTTTPVAPVASGTDLVWRCDEVEVLMNTFHV